MTIGLVAVGFALVAVSCVLTELTRVLAMRRGLLDVPNERSSHAGNVPRGGGIAVVVVVTSVAIVLAFWGRLPATQAVAWIAAGLLVAVTGLLDDSRGIGVAPRLIAHLLASVLALHASNLSGEQHWWTYIFLLLGVISSINLFNFMDGIDGIAAQQALFVAGSGFVLAGVHANDGNLWMLFVVAAASAGFLLSNWAPARIFLGDVGSGYLGFALATGGLISVGVTPLSLWTWGILHAAFVTDSTVTLFTRLGKGARVFSPHRSHAYQRLARLWRSHARVSQLFLLINVLWLLPLAWISVRVPAHAAWVTVLAYLPLTVAAVVAGAGREGDISLKR